MLEVSDAIADAMHRWREESGELFVFRECASEIETLRIGNLQLVNFVKIFTIRLPR